MVLQERDGMEMSADELLLVDHLEYLRGGIGLMHSPRTQDESIVGFLALWRSGVVRSAGAGLRLRAIAAGVVEDCAQGDVEMRAFCAAVVYLAAKERGLFLELSPLRVFLNAFRGAADELVGSIRDARDPDAGSRLVFRRVKWEATLAALVQEHLAPIQEANLSNEAGSLDRAASVLLAAARESIAAGVHARDELLAAGALPTLAALVEAVFATLAGRSATELAHCPASGRGISLVTSAVQGAEVLEVALDRSPGSQRYIARCHPRLVSDAALLVAIVHASTEPPCRRLQTSTLRMLINVTKDDPIAGGVLSTAAHVEGLVQCVGAALCGGASTGHEEGAVLSICLLINVARTSAQVRRLLLRARSPGPRGAVPPVAALAVAVTALASHIHLHAAVRQSTMKRVLAYAFVLFAVVQADRPRAERVGRPGEVGEPSGPAPRTLSNRALWTAPRAG